MRPHLIPPVLALAWGLNWPVVKIALSAFSPFTLRWVGLGSAGLLLLGVALARRQSLRPTAGDGLGIVVGGLLSVAAFNTFTAFAQLATSTSRAAVLTYTMPMMSALLAWWLLGERPGRARALALVLGLLGILLLAWPVGLALLQAGASVGGVNGISGAGGSASAVWAGLLLPLAAALAWAAGTVLTKRWPPSGPRLVHTAWQLLIGAACGALGALWAGESLPEQLPLQVVLAMVYHVVVAMALAYLLWFKLLESASATVAALTTLTVPVVGVLGAMALVGDRPSLLDGLGFVLVLSGAALVMLQLRRGV